MGRLHNFRVRFVYAREAWRKVRLIHAQGLSVASAQLVAIEHLHPNVERTPVVWTTYPAGWRNDNA